jgi:hypothetical protein
VYNSGVSGNLRFVTQYASGLGTCADIVTNTTSVLDGYAGVNNNANARYTSGRVIRLGLRLIDTSTVTDKTGIVRIL